MAIENRNLSAGTQLVATYKKQPFTAQVVEMDGKLVYRLADGQTFKSPSSAGKAVMEGKSCNGWAFWSLATADQREEATTPDAEPQPAKRGRKAKNAPAADEAASQEPATEVAAAG